MDVKAALLTELCALAPERAQQFGAVLEGYGVCRAAACGTLEDGITAYLSARRIDGLAARTLENYRQGLGRFAAWADKPAGLVSTDDLRRYLGVLADGRGLKRTSLQTHVNILRAFFGWLSAEELIEHDPMRKIRSLRVDKKGLRHAMQPEELERLREAEPFPLKQTQKSYQKQNES